MESLRTSHFLAPGYLVVLVCSESPAIDDKIATLIEGTWLVVALGM